MSHLEDNPYNLDHPEYVAQPCCGYIVHEDDVTDPDNHTEQCKHSRPSRRAK